MDKFACFQNDDVTNFVYEWGQKKSHYCYPRMILTAIYNMFVTGEEWNPSDLYKIGMPQEMLEKQKQKTIKQAANLINYINKPGIIDTEFFLGMLGNDKEEAIKRYEGYMN